MRYGGGGIFAKGCSLCCRLSCCLYNIIRFSGSCIWTQILVWSSSIEAAWSCSFHSYISCLSALAFEKSVYYFLWESWCNESDGSILLLFADTPISPKWKKVDSVCLLRFVCQCDVKVACWGVETFKVVAAIGRSSKYSCNGVSKVRTMILLFSCLQHFARRIIG